MEVYYFCNGEKPDCTKESCYKNGWECRHTADRNSAREKDGARIFKECLFTGNLIEIDPDGEKDE